MEIREPSERVEFTESDPQLKQILWSGRFKTPEGERIAILKAVDTKSPRNFSFDMKAQVEVDRPPLFKRLILSTRPFSLTATATPGLVTLGAGMILEGWRPHFLVFLLAIVSVVLLQTAVNVLNDVYDHVRGIDFPGDIGGSGVIQKGWLSARELFLFAMILLSFAVGFGIYPVMMGWQQVWWVGVIGLIGGLGYSTLGLGFKYRALGDLVVFILCGPALVTGFALVTFGQLSASILLAGFAFGFASLGILHANNLNDLEVDLQRGARTVANQIGFKRSQKYFAWIYYSIFLVATVSALSHRVPIEFAFAPILVSGVIYKMVNRVKRASGPLSPSIATIRFEAAKVHLLIGLAQVVPLLWLRLAS